MTPEALHELVKRHAPIMKFARDEQFFPMAVEPYLAKCSLHRGEGADHHRMLVPPGHVSLNLLSHYPDMAHFLVYADYQNYVDPDEAQDFESQLVGTLIEDSIAKIRKLSGKLMKSGLPEYVLMQAMENYGGIEATPPTYHYHVVDKTVSGERYHVVEYWYFYAYNDWAFSFGGVNDHEADWETVHLFFENFDDPAPTYVGFSAHDHAYIRRWRDVQQDNGHPVVYVGGGSHAAYPSDDLWRWWGFFFRSVRAPMYTLRNLNEFLSAEPWHRGTITVAPDDWAEPVCLDGSAWVADYKGQWGARYFIEDERTHEKVQKSGDSPAGPMYDLGGKVRPKWEKPVKWHQVK